VEFRSVYPVESEGYSTGADLLRRIPQGSLCIFKHTVEGGVSYTNQKYLWEVFMSKAKSGDTVKVHYTGKLEDGNVFDTSRERQPLEFTIGSGNVMPGIEKGVIGMEIGDTKAIEIPAEEAFGVRREELVVEVKKNEFPNYVTPTVGQKLQIQQQDNDPIIVIITDVNDDTVTLDANHPLAGYTLFFDVELLEIS
jgi:peptidylprolyl isomerase